jgi:hypothetical protein
MIYIYICLYHKKTKMNKLFFKITLILLIFNVQNYPSYISRLSNIFKKIPNFFYRNIKNTKVMKNTSINLPKQNLIGSLGLFFTYIPRYLYSKATGTAMTTYSDKYNQLQPEQDIINFDYNKMKINQYISDPAGIKFINKPIETKSVVDQYQSKDEQEKNIQKQNDQNLKHTVLQNATLQSINKFENNYRQQHAATGIEYSNNLSNKWLEENGFVRDDNYISTKSDIISDEECKKRGYEFTGYMNLFRDEKFNSVNEAYDHLLMLFEEKSTTVNYITNMLGTTKHEFDHICGRITNWLNDKANKKIYLSFETSYKSTNEDIHDTCTTNITYGEAYMPYEDKISNLLSVIEPFSFADKYRNLTTIQYIIRSMKYFLFREERRGDIFDAIALIAFNFFPNLKKNLLKDLKKFMTKKMTVEQLTENFWTYIDCKNSELSLKEIAKNAIHATEEELKSSMQKNHFNEAIKEKLNDKTFLKSILHDSIDITLRAFPHESHGEKINDFEVYKKEAKDLYDFIMFTFIIQIISIRSNKNYAFIYENSLELKNKKLYNDLLNKINELNIKIPMINKESAKQAKIKFNIYLEKNDNDDNISFKVQPVPDPFGKTDSYLFPIKMNPDYFVYKKK